METRFFDGENNIESANKFGQKKRMVSSHNSELLPLRKQTKFCVAPKFYTSDFQIGPIQKWQIYTIIHDVLQ